ncbi:MAG: histidine phosphatase family protein [Granulosicoccus sp.]
MEKLLVTLMRHAKSSWQVSNQSDHDRPLNQRGIKDAPAMAQRLLEKNCCPDLILCSSAQRAMQTSTYLVEAFDLDSSQIKIKAELYLASPESILQILHDERGTAKHIMIIAHNPGLEQLSSLLAPESSAHMPTSGIRHFSLAASGSGTAAELIFEDYPKKAVSS